ncbi:MAG: GNAT family N-acetyltransferase [Rhodocyclaceae bacterium]|nr:GNAT family N-acetyltransferase [Rhodocyclaceae bacterium]MCO5097810.1 GNAT family N-acetyltransferase [Rhodocyclaceae bacterium]
MKHDLILEGHAFRLRPIFDEDAVRIVELRSNPTLNRYLHASAGLVEEQLAWLAGYYDRLGDYYFAVECRTDHHFEGLVAIYDIDTSTKCGEWGRWILRQGSLAAVESAWLIYRVGFDLLGLDQVLCRTVADNVQVVSFHDSCGITERRLLPKHFTLDGHILDAIEHRLDRETWAVIEPNLKKLVRLVARKSTHD